MTKSGRYRGSWLWASLYGHFSYWLHSLRTILMAVFVLLMTYMLVRSFEYSIEVNRFEVHLGETLYEYASSGFNLIMTSIALLVMMSEIPKRVSYQNYVIIRLSRQKWLFSLILFSASVVIVFSAIMLILSAVFSLPFVTPGTGWSDLERLAEDANYINAIQLAPKYIRVLSPSMACILSMLVLFFFWMTMALIVLICSILNITNFGVVLCVSMLLLDITILFESLPGMRLPSQFATLTAIASQVHQGKLQFTTMILVGYIVLDLLLVLLISGCVRYMDIRFVRKE